MAKKQTSTRTSIFGKTKRTTSAAAQEVRKRANRISTSLEKANKVDTVAKKEFEKAIRDMETEVAMFHKRAESDKTLSADAKAQLEGLAKTTEALIVALKAPKVSDTAVRELLNDKADYFHALSAHVQSREELENMMAAKTDMEERLSESLEKLREAEDYKLTAELEKKNQKAAKRAELVKNSGLITGFTAPLLGLLGPIGKDLGKLFKVEEKVEQKLFKFFGGQTEEEMLSGRNSVSGQSSSEKVNSAAAAAHAASEQRQQDKEDKIEADNAQDFMRESKRIGREQVRAEKEKKGLFGGIFGSIFDKFFGKKSLLGGLASAFSKIGWIGRLLPFLGKLSLLAGASYLGYKFGQWLNDKFGLSEKLADLFSPDYDPNATEVSTRELQLFSKYKKGDKSVMDFKNANVKYGGASEIAVAMYKKAQEAPSLNKKYGSVLNLMEGVSKDYGLDAGMMTTIAGAESSFNPHSVSMKNSGKRAGGSGLFLLTDADWKYLLNSPDKERIARLKKAGITGDPSEKFDPTKNAIAAAELMLDYKANATKSGMDFNAQTAYAQLILGNKGLDMFKSENAGKSAVDVFGAEAAKNNPALFYDNYSLDKDGNIMLDADGNPVGKGARKKTVGEIQSYVQNINQPAADVSAIMGIGQSSGAGIQAKTEQQINMMNNVAASSNSGTAIKNAESANNKPVIATGGATFTMDDIPFAVNDTTLMLAIVGAVQ